MNSINRRSVLAGLGAVGTGLLAACGNEAPGAPSLLSPSGSQVARAARSRSGTGRVQSLNLTAAPATLDLGGGVLAKSWAFGGRVPGKEIRTSAGDTLSAELSNQLPGTTATSIHWHGISLRGDMDGVPPVTQPPCEPDPTSRTASSPTPPARTSSTLMWESRSTGACTPR